MIFNDLTTAYDWLDQQSNKGPFIGTERIRYAMELLGNPHQDLPVIHVTGTNGKGSSVKYLQELLLSQGVRVASFTSPHIMRFNERIVVNGQEISDAEVLQLLNEMYQLNEQVRQSKYGNLFYFEICTIMASLYFKEQAPDVCLIEVGIGGARDATNIFDAKWAIITSVALDHQDTLGDTVGAIAQEKAGIIKPAAAVITGRMEQEALVVIADKVQEEKGRHYHLNVDFGYSDLDLSPLKGTQFRYWNQLDLPISSSTWFVSMLGKYQVENASLAIQAFILWMADQGRTIEWLKAIEALAHTTWMARLERVKEVPLIYIDGAHNEQGLLALSEVLKDYFPATPLQVLYAGLSSKNQAKHLPILESFGADNLYLTQFDHNLATTLAEYQSLQAESNSLNPSNYHWILDWREFLAEFISQAPIEQTLLITGSLYFVSEVREFLRQEYQ